MIIHGCGFICVIVVMSVMGSHHDASFVFTSFQNQSGWSSDGVAWCLGLLTTSYGFVGYDAAAHMSEEMKNAARDMPRAMFGSVVVSGILTFPYIIALLFAIGDIDDLLASPTGSPITQLFVNVTGSNAGGIALNCIITIIATVATTGTSPCPIIANSRFPCFQFSNHMGLCTRQRHPIPQVLRPCFTPIQRPRQRHPARRRFPSCPRMHLHRQHHRLQRLHCPLHRRHQPILLSPRILVPRLRTLVSQTPEGSL